MPRLRASRQIAATGLIVPSTLLTWASASSLTSGVIAASGTLAQIIPPSLVLIVLADQLGRSVGDMYEGAFIPGLVLSAMYAGYVFLITMVYPNRAPGLPPEAQTLRDADGKTRRFSLLVVTVISLTLAYGYMKLFTTVCGAVAHVPIHPCAVALIVIAQRKIKNAIILFILLL